MNNKQLKLEGLSLQELNEKEVNLRREFFTLTLQKKASGVQNYSQFKKIRRNIARILTHKSLFII